MLFILYLNPGLAHGLETRVGPSDISPKVQVLLRRHLPAVLEAEINRSKFTRRENSQANIDRQMKGLLTFFYTFENCRLGAKRSVIFPLGHKII